MKMEPIMQLGKGSVTPENTAAVDEALAARELIKISVLQNCLMIRVRWQKSLQKEHMPRLYR